MQECKKKDVFKPGTLACDAKSLINVIKLLEQNRGYDTDNCEPFFEITDYLGIKDKQQLFPAACYYLDNIPYEKQSEKWQKLSVQLAPSLANMKEDTLKKCIEKRKIRYHILYHIELGEHNLYTLDGLEKLKDLFTTSCTATSIKNCPENCIHRVESISLKQNNLQSFNPLLLNIFPNLTDINVSSNKITILKKGIFCGLKNGTSLDLRNNQIKTIEDGAFKKFFHGTIMLNNNQLNEKQIKKLKNVFGLSLLQRIGKYCNTPNEDLNRLETCISIAHLLAHVPLLFWFSFKTEQYFRNFSMNKSINIGTGIFIVIMLSERILMLLLGEQGKKALENQTTIIAKKQKAN